MTSFGTKFDNREQVPLGDSIGSIVSSILVKDVEEEKNDPDKDFLTIPAPNIIEFVSSAQYLNIVSVFEHKRQYQVLRDFFQYRCPICNPQKAEAIDCWDKSREYLEAENLLIWDKSANEDVCPRCRTTRTEFEEDKLLKTYNQLHGIVGMRSGKTATVGMMGTWVEHRLINIALQQPDGRLASYFNLLPKQPFEVTYIASTEVQSNDTIWAYYKSMRNDSAWFQRYVGWVKKQEKKQKTTIGMKKWKYQETGREITNGHIGVNFNSKNSNSSGLAGRTRIASFVDELSRFRQTESSLGAEEAYRVMENSLRTVRSAVQNHKLLQWMGLMGSISSPISIDDKGMELLMQADRIESMYYFHYATWDFNPNEKREYYDEAYEKDPIGTERDFGAKPPLAANPLIIEPEKFESRAVDVALKPTATIEIVPFVDKTGQNYLRAQMIDCALIRDAPRGIVFDAGVTFDSFAGGAGHLEIKQLPDDTIEHITVVDWLFRVLPSEEREVWQDSCVDIVKTMIKSQKISMVEFDRWNSVTLIQHIRNEGVRAEQVSIRPADYIKFTADSIMGRVRLLPKQPEDDRLEVPFKSAAAVGLYELERLERSIDDRRIFNPQKGKRRGHNSDDVAVILVHLHKMLQDSVITPTGAKVRSREARLKNEEVGSQLYNAQAGGQLFNTTRLGGRRRW